MLLQVAPLWPAPSKSSGAGVSGYTCRWQVWFEKGGIGGTTGISCKEGIVGILINLNDSLIKKSHNAAEAEYKTVWTTFILKFLKCYHNNINNYYIIKNYKLHYEIQIQQGKKNHNKNIMYRWKLPQNGILINQILFVQYVFVNKLNQDSQELEIL
jgi:hypothetical protein